MVQDLNGQAVAFATYSSPLIGPNTYLYTWVQPTVGAEPTKLGAAIGDVIYFGPNPQTG